LWLEDFDEEKKKKSQKRKEARRYDMGFSEDNMKGVVLALLSSGFIGASFIIKKKGLRRAAATSGVRAGEFFFRFFFFVSILDFLQWVMCLILEFLGVGGYSYLLEPLWWLGMITSKLSSVLFP
jgi:hypothetical protein